MGLLLLTVMACSQATSFRGTELASADPAPTFRLTDQFGAAVGLADFSGKPVVLTFLYTNCPDVCPNVTETLRRTHELLGSDADQVEFLAVTVDPQRDSVERAHQYSQEKDMQHRWRFLVGSEEQLEPIWSAYWLDPVRDIRARERDPDGDTHSEGEDDLRLKFETGTNADLLSSRYLLSHTAPVFLIDRNGYRRVVFANLSLDPGPLVHDIRLLMR